MSAFLLSVGRWCARHATRVLAAWALLIAALGGVDYSGLGFHVREGNDATFVDFGAVLTAIINFLLIAAVIYFLLVAPMNKLDEAQKRRKGIDPEEPTPTETELLTEIRDLLANQNPTNANKPSD